MRSTSGNCSLFAVMVLVCAVGLVASVVPSIVYTDTFYGVNSFVDKELFASADSSGVIITAIDAGSPASAAGLRVRDRVLSVNGVATDFGNLLERLATVRAGDPVTIDVQRGVEKLRLVSKGAMPKFEAVLFLDWQFFILRRSWCSCCCRLRSNRSCRRRFGRRSLSSPVR